MIAIAFLCGFFMDFLWAKTVAAVSHRRPAFAAHLSVLLYACSFVSTILIVDQNIPAIISFVAGNWIGTYVAIKWWIPK